MLDFEIDELEPYAATPDEADKESARRTLVRMFPSLNDEDSEELVELEEGKLMRFTVNRVLETMLHTSGSAFSMNRTFSMDVFYRAREEAYDLELWAESEDDTLIPESLVYKAPDDGVKVSTEDDEVVVVKKKTTPESVAETVARKVRGPSPNSKYRKSEVIILAALEKETIRGETIKVLIETFDLNKATAESYYSKVLKEVELKKAQG